MRSGGWPSSILCAGLAIAFVCGARTDDASFRLEADSPRPYTAAYLGNGAISLVTTPLATEPARCFLASVYDHTAGDVPRIASAPAWNEVDLYDGARRPELDSSSLSSIEQYRQTLDMYGGILETSYIWRNDNHRIRIQVEQFVARDRAELAAVRFTITPDFSGALSIGFPLRNWPPPHRYALERIQKLEGEAAKNKWAIWYPGQLSITNIEVERTKSGVVMFVGATAPGTGTSVGEGVAINWTGSGKLDLTNGKDSVEARLTLNVKTGESYSFTKFAALLTREGPVEASNAAKRAALAAREAGWQTLLSASEAAWHKLWDSDLVVEGDTNLQRTIHSMLFYVLGSVREDLDISTPPMGLSSAGYCGHIFWDADTYMFPPLVILHPEMARAMVVFRSRTREAARRNAERNGYKGAMFPWEAGPDGAETTPRFAFQNASSENHVNGDVALAAWQYWLATGDRNWLQHDAWPLLHDTADFWVSRVTYNRGRDRYEIANVVAVKESDIGVSNDAYTNAVAKENLELAMAAAREVGIQPEAKWRDVAEKLYLPASDSALLWYPLDRQFVPERVRHAIAPVLPEATRHDTGAMMGTEFYPILAAEIGDRTMIGRLLGPLLTPYLRPPFQVVAETPKNQNTNFITGAGAFLQQFVFGYTGLRFGERGLERRFHPVLPPGIRKLTLKNITVRNQRETLVFDSGAE
ncbi:MAG: glycoside hydrolase family 65 protein [Acidobacteriaceae bacterium]|nr:glycoside hydrolase family 65 protein [Acidobacteriaceae bacterium]